MRQAAFLKRPGIRRALRLVFGLVGALFLAVTFVQTWDSSRTSVLPAWPYVVFAFGLALVGLAAAGWSWVVLFEGSGSSRGLVSGFYTAQLGKYIPGGIWQAVGQVGLTSGPAGSGARASAGFSVHSITQLVAGAVVAAAAGLTGLGLPLWARVLAVFGLGSLLLLDRRWMILFAQWLARRLGVHGPDLIPSQAAILKSFGLSMVTIVASSSAFAVLVTTLGRGDSPGAAVLAFSLAWVVGYMAVPFPSGLGVREAVLMTALSFGAATVITASLIHRLVTIGAELVLIIATGRRRE